MPAVQRLPVGEEGEGQRLDNWLLRVLKGVPKSHIYRVIRSGEVRVNGRRAEALSRLTAGDEVRVPPVRVAQPTAAQGWDGLADGGAAAAHAPPRDFDVLFEDDHLLVVNKPAGVAVHGGSGVSFGVIEQLRRARPQARMLELVHRLDRETSGVLVVAKRRSALLAVQEQFRASGGAKGLRKHYLALVDGAWPDARTAIDQPLLRTVDAQGERRVRLARAGEPGAVPASSRVQRLAWWADAASPKAGTSLLDVRILTGRTHQIRVHLAGRGHPILGDDKYGDFDRNRLLQRAAPPERLTRMALHARWLQLQHPADGRLLNLEAPWPAELQAFVTALGPPSGGAVSIPPPFIPRSPPAAAPDAAAPAGASPSGARAD